MSNIPKKVRNATWKGFRHNGLSSTVIGRKKEPQIEEKLDRLAAKEYPKYISNITFSTYKNGKRIPIPGMNLEEIMRTVAIQKKPEIAIKENQEYQHMLVSASANCDFYAQKIFPKEQVQKINHKARINKILNGISEKAKNYLVQKLEEADKQFGFYFTDRKAENIIVKDKSFKKLAIITKKDTKELELNAFIANGIIADMSNTAQEIYLKPSQQEFGAIDFKTIKYASLQTHLVELSETVKTWMSELEKTKEGSFFGNEHISGLFETYLNQLVKQKEKNPEYKSLAFNPKELRDELNKDESELQNIFVKGYHITNMIHSLISIDRAINDEKTPDHINYTLADSYDRLHGSILNLKKASWLAKTASESLEGDEKQIFEEIKTYINNNYRIDELKKLSNNYKELQQFYSN